MLKDPGRVHAGSQFQAIFYTIIVDIRIIKKCSYEHTVRAILVPVLN
jgi:hypothetical protein